MAGDGFGPDSISGAVGYTAWASRYLAEYHASRETFGYVAINDRSNAAGNPAAVLRDPITMDDYFAARMIRWPLCLLDMDVPVDGADAFVITTAERARDLALPPVLIHACTQGMIAQNEEDQTPSLRDHGQRIVVQSLRAKSDLWLEDVDVYFPYDGFSFLTVSWIENSGWCGPGEARAFIEEHWDKERNRILIHGRIPVNPHGGGALGGWHAGIRAHARSDSPAAGPGGRTPGTRCEHCADHSRRLLLQLAGLHPAHRLTAVRDFSRRVYSAQRENRAR